VAKADAYTEAVERSAWDGEWYRRAYFDDGSPLGSRTSDECKIDSIAQSWSVISGAGRPDRTRVAMQSLNKYLVREDARLILLLTPPFDKTTHDPGYIQGYLPGVRENGAQYTHAALWAVLATALQGDGDRAFELFQMLNPITHADSAKGVDTYKVEPYVVAADVRVHRERTSRTWRVDVVHRLSELDVPDGAGGDTWFPSARRRAVHRAVHSGELEGILDRIPLQVLDVRDPRQESGRIATRYRGIDGRRAVGRKSDQSDR
jgi:cellobiose phosphorylase